MAISIPRLARARRTVLAVSLGSALGLVAGGSRDVGARAASASPAAAPTAVSSVTSCADDGTPGTLRAAVDAASDGDTIDLSALSCSLITLQNGALVSPVASLTIVGPGAAALAIDGGDVDRVIEGAVLDLEGLTLTHGHAAALGGGCVSAETLTLTDAVLSHCAAFDPNGGVLGGAAFVHGDLTMHHASITDSSAGAGTYAMGGAAFASGNATLYDSTISGNSAQSAQGTAYGGGIAANATVTLHATVIEGNAAQASAESAYGGGIHAFADVSVLDGSSVGSNSARSEQSWAYGGGISAGTVAAVDASVTVRKSTVTGNTASSACTDCLLSGGGIHAFDSATIEYATFSYNEATCDDLLSQCSTGGGAVAVIGQSASSALTLRNTTVSGNQSVGGTTNGAFAAGGGLFATPGLRVVVHNSTIAFNHAETLGGGIAASSSNGTPSELVSSIVADNHSSGGAGDIVGLFGLELVLAGSNDMVTAADAGVTLPADTSTDEPLLLPLAADAGDVTATHGLALGSPAIDTGVNPDALTCDQRGAPHLRVRDGAPDIGAYESVALLADGFDPPPDCA